MPKLSRGHLLFSRREWWRLQLAAQQFKETVEEFVADAVLDYLDGLEIPEAWPGRSRCPRAGFVYAMAHKGLTKIGFSHQPEVRARALKAALLFEFQCERGEWFRLSRKDLDHLRSYADLLENPPWTRRTS